MTSYISFCENVCVQTKTLCTYCNNNLWFTPKLRQLRQAKEEAYRSHQTIIPEILHQNAIQLTVPASTCQWITSFLTDRRQQVRLTSIRSSTWTISTGVPQGCVLSPLLLSLYTNDCTSGDPSVRVLKFADDTTVIGLIQDGGKSAYRREVEQLVL